MSQSNPSSVVRFVASLAGVALTLAPAALALPQGPSLRVLQDLQNCGGLYPTCGVIQAKDGALYGTTEVGGVHLSGNLFKMNTDGSGATDLFDFDGTTTGGYPNGLLQASDGALYGTTSAGGANNCGTIFKIKTDGTGFVDLLDFDGANTGANPYAALIQGSDGALYGTTNNGGQYGGGTAFRIRLSGAFFSVMCHFDGSTEGGNPFGSPMFASDGNVYLTTAHGGSQGGGTICQLVPYIVVGGTIWVCTPIFNFDDANLHSGFTPDGTLLQLADGYLYGTAVNGGSYGKGTVYRLKTDGSGFSVLHTFDGTLGANPYAHGPLVQLANGSLYGTAFNGGASGYGIAFQLQTDGSGFADLFDFDEYNATTGCNPWDLIAGSDGNLYGTTWFGAPGTPPVGGVVYQLLFDPASWSNYGSGLAGTLGVPALFPNADPILGTTITLTIGNSLGAPTFGIVLAGLKEASISYKGGTLLVSNYVAIVPMTIAFPASYVNFSIPNDPTLAGLEVDMQALETDPGAVKGTSLSAGLKLILGH